MCYVVRQFASFVIYTYGHICLCYRRVKQPCNAQGSEYDLGQWTARASIKSVDAVYSKHIHGVDFSVLWACFSKRIRVCTTRWEMTWSPYLFGLHQRGLKQGSASKTHAESWCPFSYQRSRCSPKIVSLPARPRVVHQQPLAPRQVGSYLSEIYLCRVFLCICSLTTEVYLWMGS